MAALSETLKVRLKPETLSALERRAELEGIKPSAYVRRLLHRHLTTDAEHTEETRDGR